MSVTDPTTTDTFTDAFGRCYIAGQEVPQPVYERHMREWFDAAELIARLWRFAAFPSTRPERVIFDPPLTEAQTRLLHEACQSHYPDDLDTEEKAR